VVNELQQEWIVWENSDNCKHCIEGDWLDVACCWKRFKNCWNWPWSSFKDEAIDELDTREESLSVVEAKLTDFPLLDRAPFDWYPGGKPW